MQLSRRLSLQPGAPPLLQELSSQKLGVWGRGGGGRDALDMLLKCGKGAGAVSSGGTSWTTRGMIRRSSLVPEPKARRQEVELD